MVSVEYFVLVLTSVFFILDPFANVPLFISFTKTFSSKEKNEIVKKSHLIAFIAFLFFCFFGNFIFDYLNIEFSSFKIAGGILLFLISMEMLFGYKTRTEMTTHEQADAEDRENVTISPLAIPLITGPGAITTGIVLFSRADGVLQIMEFVGAVIIAFLLSFFLLMQAERIARLLGVVGLKVITRVMGLLLMALAVQFVLHGLTMAGFLTAL